MEHRRLEGIERRMKNIERGSRLLRLVVGGILGAFALFLIMGITFHDHKVVEAEQFVIKDHEGTVRGSFGLIGATDMPSFTLYDKEANANVLLHLREDGAPGLWLYNKDRIRTSLAVWGNRTLLEIFDKKINSG